MLPSAGSPVAEFDRSAKIYLAGHRGLVGSALLRLLRAEGFTGVVTRTRAELDLRDRGAVERLFDAERPEYVILAAARVGGILANASFPADFLYDNLMIATNVLEASFRFDSAKVLNLGSSCIYPRDAPQPLEESSLLTGPLESTNRAYAVAKIAAIELCDAYRRQHGRDFISAMPTNLYGPNDNFDPETGHAMAALIRRFVEAEAEGAPEVVVWGTGRPLREFLHVDDLAAACLFLLEHFSEPGPINIGSGEEISIADLATMIAELVGYRGEIRFDPSKPDGTPRKRLDISRISQLGWRPTVTLRSGVERTIEEYRRAGRSAVVR